MNKKINTVTGEISKEELGKTLMHEHLFWGYPGIEGDDPAEFVPRDELIRKAVEAMKIYRRQGFTTVVDATPNECCRDPEMMKEVSEKTGVQVICSTGYYHEGMSGHGYWMFRMNTTSDPVKEIEELMVRELTVGIRNTGIKAGAIKLCSSKDDFSQYEKMFFIAGAKAQKKTRAVINTHTDFGKFGLEQAELLIENGAIPGRTVIGHMCGVTDPDYHEHILKLGFNVGFDRIGQLLNMPTDEMRLKTLKELINRGWIEQIVLSQDMPMSWLGRSFEYANEIKPFMRNYYPGYLTERFIPMMLKAGITNSEIYKMLVENPKRIFG